MAVDPVSVSGVPWTGIEVLRLQNFRLFAAVEVAFERDLTVLVAPNGGGKTALLDGVALALDDFCNAMARESLVRVKPSDPRLAPVAGGSMVEEEPVRLEAAGLIDGHPTSWGWTVMTPLKLGAVQARAHDLVEGLLDNSRVEPPILPVIAAYDTERGSLATSDLTDDAAAEGRFNRPLDVYRRDFRGRGHRQRFDRWFEAMMLEAATERESGVASPHRPELAIKAVRRATDEVLKPSGWSRLSWDFIAREVMASHPEYGRLPVTWLSDGVRTMLALVTDLAHRCVRLNPHLGADAAAKTPGVVLIDEVDLHLHPAWQQTVIASLREAFPAVQLIVTTHSPQVLSTVEARCIRLIELGEGAQGIVTTPGQQTRGVASGDVLAAVLGVDPIPDVPEWAKLRRYHAMIEDGEWESDAAKALRVELEAHFGARHPAMLDCDRLIRFQAFRLRRTPEESAR